MWATSKHDVYLISNDSLMHWSSISRNLSEVLNFSGRIVPTEKCAGNLLEGLTLTQISTMAVKKRSVVAGGFQGELIFWTSQGLASVQEPLMMDNAITNAIEIYGSASCGPRFMEANNDWCEGVRHGKISANEPLPFPWPRLHLWILKLIAFMKSEGIL